MNKLQFPITINAPVQKVWDTMRNHGTYEEWTAASWPGSSYDGEWKVGEKIKFAGEDGSGTLAEVTDLRPYEYVSMKHIGILQPGGVVDTESELAGGWIGTLESYTFSEKDDATELTVEIQTSPDWEEMFKEGWPTALQKLKEICERE